MRIASLVPPATEMLFALGLGDAVVAVSGAPRPRVAALEWLDPPFAGGHWVPEMIELAGGTDPIGRPGRRSPEVSWREVAAAEPEGGGVVPWGLYPHEGRQQ